MNPYLPVDKQNIDNIPLDEDETNKEEQTLIEDRDYIEGFDDGEEKEAWYAR